MEIIIADNAGFCFGVKRAVGLTQDELSKKENSMYSLGPLIHNPQVVEDFAKRGLKVLDSMDELGENSENNKKVAFAPSC